MQDIKLDYKYDAVIVGAGLAGLSAAHKLRQAGKQVLVVESSQRLGGSIWTKKCEIEGQEALYEFGPNSFLSKAPYINQLIEELGLETEIIKTDFKGSKRFIHINGELLEVPIGPIAFLGSRLLSFGAKLRILCEPFFSKKNSEEESVSDFIERKFGKEVLDNLVSTFLQGIWAGDVVKLSANSVMKKLVGLEQEFGSIFAGMLFAKKDKSPKKLAICSFAKGMQSLIEALAKAVGEEQIIKEAQLNIIGNQPGVDSQNYQIQINHSGQSHEIETANLIFANKSFQAAELMNKHWVFKDLADKLSKIYYAPVALLALKASKDQLPYDLNGFGYLVNESSATDTIGTLWSSSMFKERELKNHYLTTTILGGAKRTEILTKENLAEHAISEQKQLLGLEASAKIELLDQMLIEKAIPQYELGHSDKIIKIKDELKKHPGVYLLGNYIDGVSLDDTIRGSFQLAEQL